jgi:signal transduction histidine kinase/CheY-like chemotaxis protein
MFAPAFERHARPIRECRRGGAHRGRVMPLEAEDDVTTAVHAEQVRSLFRQIPIALSVNFVNAALVAIVLAPLATRPFPLPWFVSVVLVTIGRGILWLRYRHAPVQPENTRCWLRLATCGSLLSGLCWGIGGIILFPVLPALGQLFLIIVMGGMCAGAMAISASHLPSLLAFLVATGLPMALRFFAQGSTKDSVLAAMIVVFVAALSLAGRHFSKIFAEALRLRFELKEANLRLAEANLRLQAEMVEHRATEAELQRLNAELARAKTVAEEANLSKTRFLAAASHDILQPLNSARLYASSLSEAAALGGGAERADLARNVDVSLEAVEEILGALLDISRLDAGATRPEISDVPVADLMRMLEVEFAPLARAKGLELRFAPTTLAIRTDRRLMRRLLQNLVSNALKYTLKGRVLVGCRRAGGEVRIEVWDTGLGIPRDRQRAVFEEFQRLDQGARVARGLGLGLSIVERLGRVLGHPVGLNSRPGEGSVFSVTAPRGEAAPTNLSDDGAPAAALGGEPLSGLKILAIDNEPRVLEGMRALMSRWGCAVATAHGLAEAREALASFGAADVVIADYHLDEGDGIETIRSLRDDLGRSVPAILATADRSPEVRDRAAGEDVVILNKPLKPAPLRAQLTRYGALREAAE